MDPVMRDLDRYLASQETAERLWEETCEWILRGEHVDYYDDDEVPVALTRIAHDGPTEPGDDDLWQQAEAVYMDTCSPY